MTPYPIEPPEAADKPLVTPTQAMAAASAAVVVVVLLAVLGLHVAARCAA